MARLLKPRAIPVAWVLAWSAAVMVAVAVPAGMLAADPLNVPFIELDSEWHRQVEQWRTPFLDGVNAVLNWFGYTGALTFHTALVAVLLLRRRPLAAAFATAAGLGALGITQ